MSSFVSQGYVIHGKTVERAGNTSASASYSAEQTSLTHVTLTRTVTDHSDGSGALFGGFGTVLYGTGAVSLKVVADFVETTYKTAYEDANAFENAIAGSGSTGTNGSQKGGEHGTQSFREIYAASSLIVRYRTGAGIAEAHSMSVTPPPVQIDLCPYTTDFVVPGSVMFTWMGTAYVDFEGMLYRGRTETDPGILSGTMDYQSGIATMTDYVVNGTPSSFVLNSLWTRNGRPEPIASITFSTALAPVKPGGLVVSVTDVAGTQLLATADLDGRLDAPHIYGKFDYESGLAEVQFGDYVVAATLTEAERAEWWYDPADIDTSGKIWRPWPVLPDTLRYNAIAYTYLPMDANILGVDPVRLPSDGRVPIFRRGDTVMVLHQAQTAPITPTLVSDGEETWYEASIGRSRIAWARVTDANGAPVTEGYSFDRAAGKLKWATLDGLATPVSVTHAVSDLRLVTDVQISGWIEVSRPLTHAYPAGESLLSSCLVIGDRRARVSAVWDQNTWTPGDWSDAYTGTPATATLNTIAHPVQVTNEGAETERWLLRWTTTTNVELIGEHVGLVYSGPFTSDIAPINPATRTPDGSGGVPYLVIPVAANGGGWSSGNVVRINTVAARADFWVAQSIAQSDIPDGDGADGCELHAFGNIDRP